MYCTVDKVREASELLENAEIIPDEKITPWIGKAQERIDTALRSRYLVPLAEPVPGIIQSIAQDMAAGFMIASVFSNHLGQEQINLSNQFLKRAEADLADVMADHLLDGLTGVKLANQPGGDTSPAMASTTPRKSPMERIIKAW